MTSSLLSSANPGVNVNSDRSSTRRRKKKKIQIQAQAQAQDNQQQQQQNEWKSEMQQQIYSSKLLQALRQVRGANSKRVHEAADKVLATAAKGRTRWSRAILRNRVKLKFMKRKSMVKRQREVISSSSGKKSNSKLKILRLKSKSLPAVQRKVRVLGRLVPGCRKQPMPVVLEEATDYIAALEMQVRAMSALAELLSVSGSGSGSGSGPSTAQGHASTSSN